MVSSSGSSTGWVSGARRWAGGPEPVLEARTCETLTSKNSLPFSIGRRPSELRRVARSALADMSTPWAPGSSGISRIPRPGSFHSAITGEADMPAGRERWAMP